jgi:hypothetical protein
MTEQEQKNIFSIILSGYTPLGFSYARMAVRWDFSVLMSATMTNGTTIYGLADKYNRVTLLDPWDWLSMGGTYILAREKKIDMETVE